MSLKVIHDQLRTVTECSIHLGQMQDPRILPCGHSFCLKCLLQCNDNGKGIVTCPLDRISHKIADVRKLPVNYAIVDWLALIGDVKNQQLDVCAEVETVQSCFQQTENECDYVTDRLKKSLYTVEAQKCSLELKQCLSSKQNLLESYFNEAQSAKTEDAKDHSMASVLYSCNFMQKLCIKCVNPAFEDFKQSVARFDDVLQKVKYVDVIDFNLKPDKPMHEGKVCQAIMTITDTVLRESNCIIENPKKFAEKVSIEIKQKFGNHLWTVLVGKVDMKLSIMCSEDDYISLTMGEHKIVVYRSNPSSKVYEKSEKSCKTFVQTELQSMLKQKQKNGQVHIEKILKECLMKKFNGEWHVVSWIKNTGGVHCTGTRMNLNEVEIEERIYSVWQCVEA